MSIIKNTIVYTSIIVFLSGCSSAISSYGEKNYQIRSTTSFADNCKNPRETITLYPDGKGIATLTGKASKPITWSRQGRNITLTSESIQAVAYINDQKDLTIESSSKTKNANIPMHERVRYRCLKKAT